MLTERTLNERFANIARLTDAVLACYKPITASHVAEKSAWLDIKKTRDPEVAVTSLHIRGIGKVVAWRD